MSSRQLDGILFLNIETPLPTCSDIALRAGILSLNEEGLGVVSCKPMANIQEIFNNINEKKHEQKQLKKVYKEALDRHFEYNEVVSKIKALRETKKRIEETIQADFSSEMNRLDAIKTDIESDQLMMSDLALNSIVKGERPEIQDQYENKYEPIVKVSFKKVT